MRKSGSDLGVTDNRTGRRDSTSPATTGASQGGGALMSEMSRKGTCNEFSRTGECRFGDKCKYLHVKASDTRMLRSGTQLGLSKEATILFASRIQDGEDPHQLYFQLAEESMVEESEPVA